MGPLHPTSYWKSSSKTACFSCWLVLLWEKFRLEGCVKCLRSSVCGGSPCSLGLYRSAYFHSGPKAKAILVWISDWVLDRRNYCSAAGVHRGV
uniref:Uncharacterized protein n=1 Tax=Solanum lycopersicum TaxID=4081 RepID=A0A3Q7F2N5_SOLLC